MTSVVTPTAIPMASSLKNLAEITVDNDEAKILTILLLILNLVTQVLAKILKKNLNLKTY